MRVAGSVSVSLANASGDKIFETRADSGSRCVRSAPPFTLSSLSPSPPGGGLLFLPIFTSAPFFHRSPSPLPSRRGDASVDSGEGALARRRGEMHYVWQRFHSARLSLFSLGRFRRHCTYPAVNSFTTPAPPMKQERQEKTRSRVSAPAAGGCASLPAVHLYSASSSRRRHEAFRENMYQGLYSLDRGMD